MSETFPETVPEAPQAGDQPLSEGESGPAPVITWNYYIIYDDGTLEDGTLEAPADQPPVPVLARPGRVVTKEEYDAALADWQDAQDEIAADREAAEAAAIKANYDALIAMGIPDALARSLTGYRG